MKRVKKTDKETKGVKLNLSEVYEVEFTRDLAGGQIKKGDKKLVSLPIAVKFYNQGKAKLNSETIAIAKEKGLIPEADKVAKKKEDK